MQKILAKFSIVTLIILMITLTQCSKKENNIYELSNSWEIAVPNQEIPEGITSLSAEHCGTCHQKHYEEWKLSTHAHAWTDLQFQSEIKKESSPFMCINCHIPLQNQQEYIVTGLVDGDIYKPVKEKNPKFDQALQQEGINCASCHVRNNEIIGPTGTDRAPHKSVKDSKFLSENLCISCHNAVAVVTPTLACSFETGDEWKAGPYFEKENCIDCHMQVIEREIVAGFGKQSSRLHYFPGSGIPKIDTVETKILNGLTFYPNDLEKSYSLKDSIVYRLKVKNEFAGHKVPTGDPERFFNFEFLLKNTAGDTLLTKTDRIGEHWEWHPEAKKISDNNLLPNEERTFSFSYQPVIKDRLTLSITVKKHRLNKKSAEYNKLTPSYPLSIIIYHKVYHIEII